MDKRKCIYEVCVEIWGDSSNAWDNAFFEHKKNAIALAKGWTHNARSVPESRLKDGEFVVMVKEYGILEQSYNGSLDCITEDTLRAFDYEGSCFDYVYLANE